MGTAAGKIAYCFDDIRHLSGVHGRSGAHRGGKSQFGVVDIDCCHIGTQGGSDHDGREPDTSTAVHCDPLTCRYRALVDNGPKRSDKPTTQCGCSYIIDLFRNFYKKSTIEKQMAFLFGKAICSQSRYYKTTPFA